MKKKIRNYFYGIGAVAIVLTAVFSALLFYNLFRGQVQKDLKMTAQMLSYDHATDEATWKLRGEVEGIRITLVSPVGMALLDTDADISTMENHSDRPEIVSALELGQGQAVRHSSTLAEDTFYYAVRLEDGNVLRLAKNSHSVWVVFAGVLPGALFVVLLVFGLCLGVTGRLTRRIVVPIEKMVEQLEQTEALPPYDELVPFARALKQKNEDIHSKIEHLELQKQQINLITSNMNEGLILLDANKNILSANTSAIRMLGASGSSFTGKSLIYLSRDGQLEMCVDNAAQGKNQSLEAFLNQAHIQIFASPVYNEDTIEGVMCLLLDISERKRSEKMRREFTTNVSHELKTPLTSICGYAELLAGGTVKKADAQEFGGRIHRESMRLLDLITDIIGLSELDDAPRAPEFTDCKLLTLAKDCASALESAAQKQGVTLRVEGEECCVSADPTMMEQLIRNLLDNGIRYNKPGGNVTVSVEKRENTVVLHVKDTGIGIGKAHQDRIFERFYRVDKSRSKATGGTGLGLAIVKHIAECHRATINLLSEVGTGTEVVVRFPEQKQF